MSFPKLIFPLTVDFSETGYWIGEQGPFKYGEAVTAFFTGEDFTEVRDDGIPLLRELEQQWNTIASFGKPRRPVDALGSVRSTAPNSLS